MAIQSGPDGSVLIDAGELCVRREVKRGVQTIALYGEMDFSNADMFTSELTDGIDPDARVIIDLSGLQFIDSAGLRRIVQAADELRQTKGLRVIRPPAEVARLFALTGMDKTVPFAD